MYSDSRNFPCFQLFRYSSRFKFKYSSCLNDWHFRFFLSDYSKKTELTPCSSKSGQVHQLSVSLVRFGRIQVSADLQKIEFRLKFSSKGKFARREASCVWILNGKPSHPMLFYTTLYGPYRSSFDNIRWQGIFCLKFSQEKEFFKTHAKCCCVEEFFKGSSWCWWK